MVDNLDISEIVRGTSFDSGVPEKKIWDILFELRTGQPVANNKLIQSSGVSRNALNQIKRLLSRYLTPSSSVTCLNQIGIAQLQSVFSVDFHSEESSFGYFNRSDFDSNLEYIRSFQSQRLSPERKYDQFIATPETVARRVSLMQFFSDIRGKRILFLGDDDFTSVPLAHLGITESVTVLDIDRRILDKISSFSLNTPIQSVYYDARKNLPGDLSGRFDVVFTDPPYTPEGVSLFLSRAVQLLDKENLSARIYICYGNSDRAKERFIPIYKIIADSGLMIRWVFDKFNRYSGAESIGDSSTLFITEVTPVTRPQILGDYDQSIYTHH